MKYYIKVKKFILRNIVPLIFKYFPLKLNVYLFSSFYGRYDDSPRYISEKLHLENPKAKIIWIVDPDKQNLLSLPSYVKQIKIDTLKSIYALWTSRYLIDNCQKQLVYKLRKGQFYLQTWHGTPLKKIEFDAKETLPKHYLKYSAVDHSSISSLLVGNSYSEKIFKTAFKVDENKIYEVGIPRNDIFFKDNENFKRKFRTENHINENTFIVLYAPTYRNSLYKKEDNGNGIPQLLKLNPEALQIAIKRRWGKECLLITHFHPNVADENWMQNVAKAFKDNVLDLTNTYSAQELMLVSDMLITDYSSVLFDFALSEKPIILFNYDYQDYLDERGVYVPINKLPLISARNSEELTDIIKQYSITEIVTKSMLLNKTIGNFENGEAVESAVSLLLSK